MTGEGSWDLKDFHLPGNVVAVYILVCPRRTGITLLHLLSPRCLIFLKDLLLSLIHTIGSTMPIISAILAHLNCTPILAMLVRASPINLSTCCISMLIQIGIATWINTLERVLNCEIPELFLIPLLEIIVEEMGNNFKVNESSSAAADWL